MGRTSNMPVQRMQSTPQQQQMANMMARDIAEAQQRPYRTDQPQQDMVRTNQPIGLPAGSDRVGVPSMGQLMSGIYGGGMGGGMGRGRGRGMGFGGFNPYMGGRGMGFGGFNPYMAQPQPMQLPDFARQMYGIGQRTNPYASMERIMPYVPPRQTGPEFGGIPAGIPQNTGGMASNMGDLELLRNTMATPGFRGNPYVNAFL